VDAISGENVGIGVLTYLWIREGFKVAYTDKEVKASKIDDDTVKFWRALLKELLRDDPEGSLSFKGTSSAERGTAAARVMYMKEYLKKIKKTHLVKFLSPALYSEDGGKETEWLSVYLGRTATVTDPTIKRCLMSATHQILACVAEKRYTLWESACSSFKAPVSEIFKGIHRTREIVEKRSKKNVTLHPNRPSERAGVLFGWEKEYLLEREKDSFTVYKTLVNRLNGTSGVLMKDVESTRLELTRLVQLMWTVVQSTTAVLTAREKSLSAFVKDSDIGNKKGTKENYILYLGTIKSLSNRFDVTQLGKRIKLFSLLDNISRSAEDKVCANGVKLQFKRAGQCISVPGTPGETLDAALREISNTLDLPLVATEVWAEDANPMGGGFGHLSVEGGSPTGSVIGGFTT
jgi:hypothetical protein